MYILLNEYVRKEKRTVVSPATQEVKKNTGVSLKKIANIKAQLNRQENK